MVKFFMIGSFSGCDITHKYFIQPSRFNQDNHLAVLDSVRCWQKQNIPNVCQAFQKSEIVEQHLAWFMMVHFVLEIILTAVVIALQGITSLLTSRNT